MDKENILEVHDLHVHYKTDTGIAKAVNGVSLTLAKGESLGLVGETGAGKTTTALAIMQLVPDPPGVIENGEIIFKGKNIIYNTERENQEMRGDGISMISQDPMTALNPVMTVGEQLTEVILHHKKVSKKEAERMAKELMETVGVKADRFRDLPHQFSGGMKQRVIIAMALLCRPEILIADEPTTALDVTIQAQVLDLIRSLIKQYDMSMLLITHDLGVVGEVCDRVAIMYAGEIVEEGSVLDVYTAPKHPYTQGLFDSLPDINSDENKKLIPIPGVAPNATDIPSGCAFNPRCRYKQPICEQTPPISGDGNHWCRCHFPLK